MDTCRCRLTQCIAATAISRDRRLLDSQPSARTASGVACTLPNALQSVVGVPRGCSARSLQPSHVWVRWRARCIKRRSWHAIRGTASQPRPSRVTVDCSTLSRVHAPPLALPARHVTPSKAWQACRERARRAPCSPQPRLGAMACTMQQASQLARHRRQCIAATAVSRVTVDCSTLSAECRRRLRRCLHVT